MTQVTRIALLLMGELVNACELKILISSGDDSSFASLAQMPAKLKKTPSEWLSLLMARIICTRKLLCVLLRRGSLIHLWANMLHNLTLITTVHSSRLGGVRTRNSNY